MIEPSVHVEPCARCCRECKTFIIQGGQEDLVDLVAGSVMNLNISSVLVEYRDKIKSLAKHRSRVTRQVSLSHGTSRNQGQGRLGV